MINPEPSDLIGEWTTDPEDFNALQEYGNITLNFREGGKLDYTIRESGKYQIILLTYRAEKGVIATDQPSAPRIEQTPYRLTDDGKLVLGIPPNAHTFIRKRES